LPAIKQLTLYSTSACHLCENAKKLIWPFLHSYGYTLREVDIVESENLMQVYGLRIPVISFENGGELDWPFTDNDLNEFFQGH